MAKDSPLVGKWFTTGFTGQTNKADIYGFEEVLIKADGSYVWIACEIETEINSSDKQGGVAPTIRVTHRRIGKIDLATGKEASDYAEENGFAVIEWKLLPADAGRPGGLQWSRELFLKDVGAATAQDRLFERARN